MVRDGAPQETYWNYSLTPNVDEAGSVVGLFNQGSEVTKAVINEGRLGFQIMLADKLRGLSDPEKVKSAATALLGEYLNASRVGFAEVDEVQGRFGSRLVGKGLAADLSGTATLHFESHGLRCVIEASMDAIETKETEIG